MDIRTSIWHKLLESFQLEDSTSETEMKVREVWEECMPQLFSTAMYNAREDAMAETGVENIKDCRDFPPAWLSREIWNKLIDVWKTSEWHKKSKIAVNNRLGSNQGFGVVIHVGGTAPMTRHEKNLEAELGREPLYMETYDRTHKRKGSNDCCDLRSNTVAGKYKATILQKYEDPSTQPRIDVEAWSNAGGGPTKGRVLGRSTRDRASSILGTSACSSSSRCSTRTSSEQGQSSQSAPVQYEQLREAMRAELVEHLMETVMQQVTATITQQVTMKMREERLAERREDRKKMKEMMLSFASHVGIPPYRVSSFEPFDDDDDDAFTCIGDDRAPSSH